MRLLENILRKLNEDVRAQAQAVLSNQTPDNPALHLGKGIGVQNGLMRAIELIAQAVEEERRIENDRG